MDQVVDARAEAKLVWFKKTMTAVYETRQHWKRQMHSDIESQADGVDWFFDWQPVIRYLAPEILVVMSDDPRKRELDVVIPTYLIFPRDGDWITVEVESLLLEPTDEVAALSGETIERGLLAVQASLSHVEEQRRGEVMKHIRAIRRILSLTA